jgi:hypothetical protein
MARTKKQRPHNMAPVDTADALCMIAGYMQCIACCWPVLHSSASEWYGILQLNETQPAPYRTDWLCGTYIQDDDNASRREHRGHTKTISSVMWSQLRHAICAYRTEQVISNRTLCKHCLFLFLSAFFLYQFMLVVIYLRLLCDLYFTHLEKKQSACKSFYLNIQVKYLMMVQWAETRKNQRLYGVSIFFIVVTEQNIRMFNNLPRQIFCFHSCTTQPNITVVSFLL